MGEQTALAEECRIGWLSVEKDFKARLLKPELLKHALQMMGRNPSDKAIECYWSQAGGSLSFEQFSLVMRREKKTSMSDLMRAFRKIDSNGDGFITAQELQRTLTKRGEKMSASEVQAIIAEADLNGDGKLDYAEFCHMLLNTSEECTRIHQNKASQVLKAKEGQGYRAKSRKYRSSNYSLNENRASSYDRRERRREEIRMQLYSPTTTERISQTQDLDGVPLDQGVVQGSPSSQPSPIPIASTATVGLKNSSSLTSEESGKVTNPGTDPRVLLTKLPPLKKEFLPPLTIGGHTSSKEHGENGRECLDGYNEASMKGSSHCNQDETDKLASSSRQTDHLHKDKAATNDGESCVHQNVLTDKAATTDPPGESHHKNVSSDKAATNDGGDSPGESRDDQIVLAEQESSGIEDGDGGKSQESEEPRSARTCESSKKGVDSANGLAEDKDKEACVSAQNGSLMNGKEKGEVSKDVVSAVTAPPKKPKNIETWNSISGKGCFYLECEGGSGADEAQCVIKSQRYHLKLPAPSNVWVEVGVAKPGLPETDVLLFVFKTNEREEVTDIITYTQHKLNDGWICRMDLDPGTYAIIPFTSGCQLKPLEEEESSDVALVASTEGSAVLTSECQSALEEVFHRIDLDGNGYISRTEFDFFQEVTSGEFCDDDAWNIILSNFDVTSEREITLKGFLALHEMTASDEGGEEELWQVMKSLGYNRQLQLRQACPFLFEVFTEDCEGEIEIVDLLPFSADVHPALVSMVMERGVVGAVQGGDQDELATYTFTTPDLTTIVVENKSTKIVHVQLDCSQSVNCVCHRESSVHVMEVEALSSSVGYFIQPADTSAPHNVRCIVSKILA